MVFMLFFFFQAEDGIRDAQESRGLGDVYKRQPDDLAQFGLRQVLMRAQPPEHMPEVPDQAPGLGFLGLDAEPHASTALAADGQWVDRAWLAVQPGDIIKLVGDQIFPADVFLVSSSDPKQTCVDASCLDGDTNWLQKHLVGTGMDLSQLGAGGAATPETVAALLSSGEFQLEAPSANLDQPTYGTFVPASDQVAPTGLASRHLIPQGARLVFTEWVVCVVGYVGEDTKVAQNGGLEGRDRENHKRLKIEQDASQRAEQARQAALPSPIDPGEFEAATGFRWSPDGFTDVPDDGNCMVHAIWLGLQDLAKIGAGSEETTESGGPDPASFRGWLADQLWGDELYQAAILAQLTFWVQEVDVTLLLGLEDFFLLPESLQQSILDANQLWRAGVREVDYNSMLGMCKEALVQTRDVNGRATYVPLGEHELDAAARLLGITIHVMKNQSLTRVMIEDPRTVPPNLIHTINPGSQRIVRLLNVNSNHYKLHQPIGKL
eukprot:TRINITY_DN30206_c0_g1_i1.p1 TRINITY_DN30206_c0_g1~~TRINITY_DN30206_c0_g1_i1.p1  ORF type:complete len:492 (-),score=104.23 TRINITY_DN30206_c0_g1_i1:11-1486(-)